MEINELLATFDGETNAVALGPSSLAAIARGEMSLDMIESERIAIPCNLKRLLEYVREGSDRHHKLLSRVMRYYGSGMAPWTSKSDQLDGGLIAHLLSIIDFYQEAGRLEIITEEFIDDGLQEALAGIYSGSAFEIEMSPRRNFLRDYLVLMYSWSKRTGGKILERTRRIFSDVGQYISSLQIPDKLDGTILLKARYSTRIYSFRGGRALKFFVASVVAIAGIHNPLFGVAGVVLVFVDP